MRNKLIDLLADASLNSANRCADTDCDECCERGRACFRGFEADHLIANGVTLIPETGIEDMSDGYHTFKDLYYQRMMLTAALVKAYKPIAWKSHRHENGERCFDGGWFIVGITTPQGDYTYHYEDKYWDLFECEELPVGKPWDGHTEKDVTRLLSLVTDNNVGGKWISASERLPEEREGWCNTFSDTVLVAHKRYDGSIGMRTSFIINGKWHSGVQHVQYEITHWMPLPEPPQENEREY